MMDYDHISPAGSRSPLASSNSDPTPQAGGDYNGLQLRPPRACEYCRQHKVRCDIDPRDLSGPCGRCLKANRDCINNSHSRKRRKTTESRVLDLERKVERLTSRLEALEKKDGVNVGGASEEVDFGQEQILERDKQTEDVILPTVAVHPPTHPSTNDTKQDVIDRQIISVELAGRIFQHFVSEVSYVFPAVIFPPNTVSSDIRRQKPTLFLAILVSSSGSFDPSLQKTLVDELLKSFSEQIICRGAKSLEIVQALIVSVLWHVPRGEIGGNILNQLVHMAAVMASDLAITKDNSGKRWPPVLSSDTNTNTKGDQQWGENLAGWKFMRWGVSPDSSLPECRRTLLSCYFLCANFARLLRRPNLFPFTGYMAECVKFFETSDDEAILNSDRSFVQWIILARYGEELGIALADVTSGTVIEYRVQVIVDDFLERIAKWRQEAQDKNLITPALDLFAQCIIKHMYDLVLHSEHIADDLRPLVFESLVAQSQQEPSTLQPSKFHTKAIRASLASIHSCLDGFLAFTPSFAGSLPTPFFIEIGYSIGLLLKMFFAASLSRSTAQVLDVRQVKFGEYVDQTINFLEKVKGQGGRPGAEKLRFILVGLKSWVDGHRQKVIELSALVNKAPAPPFEQPAAAATTAAAASPLGQAYPLSPQGVMGTGPLFTPFPDADRGGEGYDMQDIDFGDPMLWDSFPMTEFLRLDGAPPWA